MSEPSCRPPQPGLSRCSGRPLSAVARQLRGAELYQADGRSLADPLVSDLSHDSRRVGPGSLFCAARGQRTDGHDFAADALRAGASALLVERFLDLPVPQLRVPSVRQALGPIAAFLHGWPSRRHSCPARHRSHGPRRDRPHEPPPTTRFHRWESLRERSRGGCRGPARDDQGKQGL